MKSTYLTLSFLLLTLCSFGQETAETVMEKGIEQLDAEQYDAAITTFTKLISMEKDNEEAYYFRGVCKYRLDVSKGLEDFDKAIALDPEFAEAYDMRANVKCGMNNLRGAILDYDKAIALDGTDGIFYVDRADTKVQLGDFKGAIADCNKAITLKVDTSNGLVFSVRAEAKFELKDYAGAVIDLNKAIAADPTNSNYYILRGNAKDYMNDRAGACADWKQANNLGANIGNDGCE